MIIIKRITAMLTLFVLLLLSTSALAAFAPVNGAPKLYGDPKTAEAELDAEYGYNDYEKVRIIIELEESPALMRSDFSMSNGTKKLESLIDVQNEAAENISNEVLGDGEELVVKYNFVLTVNAFATEAEYGKLDEIASLDGVKNVYIDNKNIIPFPREGVDCKTPDTGIAKGMGVAGEGMAIGIIDTGIALEHEAFSTTPENARYDISDIDAILQSEALNAKLRYGGITADDVYKSGKIPFAFDYAENDADVGHTNLYGKISDHGTHVAGIAAGYCERNGEAFFSGVAPKAQIVVFKVFGTDASGDQTGAYDSDITAALEDAVILGLDVVNMSISTNAGFTILDTVYANMRNSNVLLAAAAGNSYSSAYGNRTGASLNYIENMDNGIVGAPSTQEAAVSVAAASGDTMSEFSSWGSTSELALKPEISAQGTDIYSSTDVLISGEAYQSWSGTSMASPQIAGAMALLKEAYSSDFDSMSDEWIYELVINRLMTAATPLADSSGVYYSPRKQGVGVLNIDAAFKPKLLITTEDCDRPKLSCGDDPSRAGVFAMSFTAENITDSPLAYSIKTEILSDSIKDGLYLAQKTADISSKCTVSTNKTGDSFVLEAGAKTLITVRIELDSQIKAEFDSSFPSGQYIDGFVQLLAVSGEAYTIPYLAFYGDWDASPMFEVYDYTDLLTNANARISTTYANIAGVKRSDQTGTFGYLGNNPIWGSEAGYNEARNAISPDGDGDFDALANVYVNPMRNASSIGISITNAETGELYFTDSKSRQSKVTYDASSKKIQPINMLSGWGGTDAHGLTLPNNTKCVATVTAALHRIGYDACDNANHTFTFPITIDTEKPRLISARVHREQNAVYLTVECEDNQFVADILYHSPATGAKVRRVPCAASSAMERVEYTGAITGNDAINVYVTDYAWNQSMFCFKYYTGIELNAENIVLDEGGTESVSYVQIQPKDANAFGEAVEWSSSDEDVASVLDTGEITANKSGSAVITARNSVTGYSDTVNVYVNAKTPSRLLLAASRTLNSINTTGRLPSYVTCGAYRLSMPQLVCMLAEFVSGAGMGVTVDPHIPRVLAPECSFESIAPCAFTKSMYIGLADSVLYQSRQSSALLGGINTEAGTLGYETTVYVFARIAASYRAIGVLPDSVDVRPWGDITGTPVAKPSGYKLLSQQEVLKAARRMYNTMSATNAMPKYITMGELRVNIPQFFRLLAQTVADMADGHSRAVELMPVSVLAPQEHDSVTGDMTKSQYVAFARSIVSDIGTTGVAASVYATSMGTVSYKAALILFSNILNYRSINGELPNIVSL